MGARGVRGAADVTRIRGVRAHRPAAASPGVIVIHRSNRPSVSPAPPLKIAEEGEKAPGARRKARGLRYSCRSGTSGGNRMRGVLVDAEAVAYRSAGAGDGR